MPPGWTRQRQPPGDPISRLALPGSDCNGNGIPDACDIASFVLEDCNDNGIGDACEKQVSVERSSGVRTPLVRFPTRRCSDLTVAAAPVSGAAVPAAAR